MVNMMENPINPWMIWEYHYFWKHPIKKTHSEEVIWIERGCQDQSFGGVERFKSPWFFHPVLMPNPICWTQLGISSSLISLTAAFGSSSPEVWALQVSAKLCYLKVLLSYKLWGNLKLTTYNSAFITQKNAVGEHVMTFQW